ncbi:MAG: choice-of-anchor D domain-containing protein [Burkholderiales bacterium]
MAHISDRYGPAIRGAWFSLLVLAAVALSWHAPQAHAQAAPKASLFPPSLAFGSVATSGSSATQEIALRNTGTGPMSLSGIVSAGGNFDLTHDCPLGTDTLAAGSFCTILVRFAPEAAGLQSGVIQVLDGVLSVVQEVVVTGTGVLAGPKVVPNTTVVTFPTTAVFTTSGPMVVMFTNNETSDIYPYFLDYLPVEGEFSPFPGNILIDGGSLSLGPKVFGSKVTRPCQDVIFSADTMAPGDSCFALVYFTPFDVGLRTGSLKLGWDYCGDGCGDTDISVLLQGFAVPFSEADLSVSVSQLDFGGVVVGTPAIRTFTLTSTGYGPLTLLGFRALDEIFSVDSDCDRSLKTGSSCTVKVTCTPKGFVTVESDLYIDHDVPPGFTNVKLLCTGVERPTPKILVESTGVSFGSLSLGATSEPQEVIISSIGSAPLAISNVGTTPPFAVGGDCPPSLPPGESCVARLTFTPFAPGRQHNALEISSNDPDRPMVTVSLDGIGCRPFSILAARRGLSLCGP